MQISSKIMKSKNDNPVNVNKMNRRNFVSFLATLVAMGTIAPGELHSATDAPNQIATTPSGFKLGLVTYNLGKDMNIPTLIHSCVKTKFEGVELRTTHAHKVEVNLTSEERDAVKKRFEDSPIKLVSLGSAFDFHTPDQEKLKKDIAATKEYIRLARDVGAEAVKVRPNGFPSDVSKEKTLEQIGKSFREVAIYGADLGIDIRMEVHGNQTCLLPNIKAIVDIADHPNANVCWNSNMDDLKGEGFEYNYNLVKNKIHVCHITELWSDYPWRKLFANLKRDGFAGYTLAEIPFNSDPIRIMNYYRALWLALQA